MDRPVTRNDLMWVIEFVDQIVDEGGLTIAEGEALIWSLLEKPVE
jgi:hypothetical protein